MKKIVIAAMAVMFLFAGCMKNDDAQVNEKLNVVFSVADKTPYGVDTKALKQGWQVGDEILIVFEAESYDWIDPSGNENTILLAYDGEEWYVANQDDGLVNALRTNSSCFFAVHYPGATILLGDQDGEGKTNFQTYKGGEYLVADGDWTFDGNNIILGEINMKRRTDMFQISVLDLADELGNWTLSILNEIETSQDVNIIHMNSSCGLYLKQDGVGMRYPDDSRASGIKIGDDVAFTFIMDGNQENLDYVKFILSNGTDIYELELTNRDGLLQEGKAYLMPGIYSNYWTEK